MESTPEKSKTLIADKAIGFKTKMKEYPICSKETIIYALSIGFNEDPMNKKHFKFTYELNDEFAVFPTWASVIPINNMTEVIAENPYIPEFNMMSLLHGEEFVDFVKPLPTSGKIFFQMELADIEDKGKGTVLCTQGKIYEEDQKTVLAVITSNIFVRGLKGNGAKAIGPLKTTLPKVPTTQPIKEVQVKTHPNQALYYRIGGNDPNPLHVDPDMSIMGGFERPILHGLCFYGITGKAAYEAFADDKIDNLLSFKARFTSSVVPGESLNIKFWKGTGNNIIVAVYNVEKKAQVLVGEFTFKNPKF
jgi:acyl dehydratase